MRFSFPLSLVALAFVITLVACGPSSGEAQITDGQTGAASGGSSGSTSTSAACGSQYIPSSEAGQHLGEEGTVCGRVVDYQYITGDPRKPTLLLFDQGAVVERGSSISDQQIPETFTVVIWREDSGKFPANPGSVYSGKTVCVTGPIESHNGSPAIIAHDQSQLQVDC